MNSDIMIKKIKTPLSISIVSAIIFYFSKTELIIGKFINLFFSCEQPPQNSMPCFGIWDIYTMVLMTGIFLFSLLWIIIVFVKKHE